MDRFGKGSFSNTRHRLRGRRVLTKRLSRVKLCEYMANTTPCLVGIEAYGGAHYWSRVFESHEHTVKIMSPQFMKTYVICGLLNNRSLTT